MRSEDTNKIEVVYGSLKDKGIALSSGFKIGMNKNLFFKKIFTKDNIDQDRFKSIKIASIVSGVTHTYHFKEDRLVSIEIETDYVFSKD